MTADSVPTSTSSDAASPNPWFLGRYLSPSEIAQELLFGLIMVLAFTLGSFLVIGTGENQTGRFILSILGCNLAWGLIDATMHVMDRMMERGRNARLLLSLQKAPGEREAIAMMEAEFDEQLAPLASSDERARFYAMALKRLTKLPPERVRVEGSDVRGAISCFLLVVATAIPAVLALTMIHDCRVALRVSNGLTLVMLFLVGRFWGHATHANATYCGFLALLVGLVLAVVAVALGG